MLAVSSASVGAAVFVRSGSVGAGAVPIVACLPALLGTTRSAVARRLERLDPALDGAVTAFIEGGGGRLRDELAGWILGRWPRGEHVRSAIVLGVAALVLATALLVPARPAAPPVVAREEATSAAVPPPVDFLRLAVEVAPPAYSRVAVTRVDGPRAPIELLKGSTVALLIETSRPSVAVTEEGRATEMLAVVAGRARRTSALSRSTAIRVGEELVVTFTVVPDRAPEVELTLPREDRTVTATPGPFDVKASARDDLGLRSLTFLYTLAHGHGEGMTFKTGRIDGPRASGGAGDDPRSLEMTARLDPAALGLGRGDTLVMWAEAVDGNAVDGPSRTASPVRILRFEEELARIEMRSSAPAVRPLNGPLSQREILARTLRLLAERLPEARLAERSLDLAEEQGKLREAFGLFLRAEDGNAVELDMEEKETAELGSDRTRRLVAEAVSAMWASEGELRTGHPRGSVPHQRLALKRLDEAFGGERYALRALAPPKAPVDEGRRLKGEAKGLSPRTGPDAPPDGPSAADAARLRATARRLLLRSEGLSSVPAKELADELWALPELAGLSRSLLAAPLYAGRSSDEIARACRAAADALLALLFPRPLVRPYVAPEEGRVFARLEGERRERPPILSTR